MIKKYLKKTRAETSSLYGKKISLITLIVAEKIEIY